MTAPLDGILVVAIEQAVAAPYCTKLLADLGARVIKIERADGGDFARAYDGRARGLSSHFVWCNRGKESVALDLKCAADRAHLQRIISHADIFVQNLAPGAAARLGFSAEILRASHPRLITCDISGYGAGGPWSERKAYDLLIQAEAGFLSITGTADVPAKAGISIADIAAGIAAHNAILAALFKRERQGQGAHIDISMLEALCEWMGYPLYYALDGASAPERSGAGHATIYPYGPFATMDGSVLFGLQNDREWQSFARLVLQRPDCAEDARYFGNAGRQQQRETLHALIHSLFKTLTSDEVTKRLDEAGIANARVNTLAEVWAHPQLQARQRWVDVASAAGHLPGLKPQGADDWPVPSMAVPQLGEHTERVLAEFAFEQAANPNEDRSS